MSAQLASDWGFEPWIETVIPLLREAGVHAYLYQIDRDVTCRLARCETSANASGLPVVVAVLNNGTYLHANPGLTYSLTGHEPDGSDVEQVYDGIVHALSLGDKRDPWPTVVGVREWFID